jgi:hypothetical protein
MNLVKPDGTPITTTADLTTADMQIYAQSRNSPPIKIPPAYGTTPIGSEAWDVDANTGINQAYPGNPGEVPLGTIIQVVWQDGTQAQFIRTNSVASLLWAYVPGTMKDKNGNPITPPAGTMNPNTKTNGAGSGSANFPGSGGSGLQITIQGGNLCTYKVTVSWIDPLDGAPQTLPGTSYGPCPSN